MRSINSLLDLSGRKALITGGAGHIGGAVADGLSELGAHVSILDVSEEACRGKLDDLTAQGGTPGVSVPCDLRDEQATRQSIKDAISSQDGMDIIVHCAAFVGTTQMTGWAVPFEEQTVEAWDAAIRVNLTSAFVIAQETREALAASGHGSVIFFGSTYGISGTDLRLYENTDMANPPGYAASKAGVIQLARHLATVMAPKVRVNSVTPGGVLRGQPQSFQEKYVSRTPLGRMASEQDLKGAVAYLASDMSEYVTGHNLVVDGGWTAW
ncbi:MAG: SDR family oxidoreductase [SAR202 cluster bacterium]|nr:SDR family oxidoreductase [SAR202 cluster bacterium]